MVFGQSDFNSLRLKDSGCFIDDHLIYISTKEPAVDRRYPWIVLYGTSQNHSPDWKIRFNTNAIRVKLTIRC